MVSADAELVHFPHYISVFSACLAVAKLSAISHWDLLFLIADAQAFTYSSQLLISCTYQIRTVWGRSRFKRTQCQQEINLLPPLTQVCSRPTAGPGLWPTGKFIVVGWLGDQLLIAHIPVTIPHCVSPVTHWFQCQVWNVRTMNSSSSPDQVQSTSCPPIVQEICSFWIFASWPRAGQNEKEFSTRT